MTNAFGDPGDATQDACHPGGRRAGLRSRHDAAGAPRAHGRTRQPEEIVPFWVWALAAMAISLVPLSVAYAVVKHRVMELPVLLRRSARYVLVRRGAVTVAVLLGVVVTFIFAGRPVAPVHRYRRRRAARRAGRRRAVRRSAGTAGPRLWRPAQERIDRAFFRGAYDARRILERLARDSHAATDRDALASGIETRARGGASARGPVRIPARAGCASAPGGRGRGRRCVGGGPVAVVLARTGRAHEARAAPRDRRRMTSGPAAPSRSAPRSGPSCWCRCSGARESSEGLLVLAMRLSEEPYSSEDRALSGRQRPRPD